MNDREKVIEKIKKVLNLSKNNPSEQEAESAALKVQKMMAEYHVSMADLESAEDTEDIAHVPVDVGLGNKWKSPLANIVSNNFRCKYYFYGRDKIVFFGHKIDAEIAKETFLFLFKFGNKKAMNYYMKVKKQGVATKGVKNAYLVGYLLGIKDVLEKQSTALMIVVPKEVNDKYELMISGEGWSSTNSKGLSARVGEVGDKAKEEGRWTGRQAASSRNIEQKTA